MSELNQVINLAFLVIYIVGLSISTLAMIRRVWRFKVAKMRVPPLLWRDVYCFGTATLTIGMLLLARVIPIVEPVFTIRDNTIWYIITGLPVVTGIMVWAFFEVVLIPRNERGGGSPYDDR